MLRTHVYRWRRERFYAHFMRTGQLCFDVGANVGDRTAMFLATGATVIGVEPQTACHSVLEARFAGNRRFILVKAAAGSQQGRAPLNIANDNEASALASLAHEWVEAVRASGRFAKYSWSKSEEVEITTLDTLIDKYGLPVFVKVDVEGYELAALEGLSRPVRAVSFEFTPERLDDARRCVVRLVGIGDYRFNYSLGESLRLERRRWRDGSDLLQELEERFAGDAVTFGDVYARLGQS